MTVTGLTAGQRYYFAVKAYASTDVESTYSNEVNAVAPSAPVASFTANATQGQAPLAVSFNSSASTGSIATYAWTFGDGGTSTSANPSHTYASPGSYTVALTVSGSAGSNTLTRTGYIVVTRAPNRVGPTSPPSAAFIANLTSGVAPFAANFTSLSTGTITSYAWTFGDGSTNSAADPSHTYASAGTYTVTLTVTGPNGTDTSTRSGYIVVSPAGTPKLTPTWAMVDLYAANWTTGNQNGVLEPGESVTIVPVWHNDSAAPASPTGALSRFTGPPGAKYSINDRVASYGTIAPGMAADCRRTANCYRITVSKPVMRPAQHWDATLEETLSTGNVSKITVHIGESFADVPVSDPSYVFVETMLHHDVMSAFSDGTFRPSANGTRSEAMVATARALLASVADTGLIPAAGQVGASSYACASGGTSLFPDVAPADGECKEIHFLASFGVNVNFSCADASLACPSAPSSRAATAVLVAGAAAGGDGKVPASGTFLQSGLPRSYNCSSGGSSRFADVSVTAAYCRHVNYLWATGSLDGYSDGTFRPTGLVTRAELAQILTKGLDLTLD